ncbi:MAG: AMP-binding protein, partial [Pseudomonadota bacterium]
MPGNFYESLQTAMQANPDKLCFLCPAGESYTFAEIDRLAGQFASTLQADGVEPGDRVVVQVEKSVAAYALYLGALRCGAVFVPLNTAYTTAELSYFIEDAAPRVLILDPERTIALNAHQHDNAANPNAGQKPEPLHRTLSDDPQEGLWKTAREHQPIAEVVDRSEEDLAAIVYTSGTTGRSKGAMISHRALETNAKTLQRIWGYEPNDVLLHALPIFHIHGLFIAMHPTLLNGSTTLFLKAFNATVVRQHLAQATILMGVPTFYLRLLAEPGFGAHDCDSIRLFVSGSAPLTAQASQAWTDATGSRILERYGMTEAGIISSNPLAGERIPGTVGFALPDVDVRVCDDNGAEVRAGEVGTLEVRGPNLFSG